MDLHEFSKIVDQKKKDHPSWFEGETDSLENGSNIRNAEVALGLVLPETYKLFFKYYGGGYFAFTNIFSVDNDGEWNIVDKNDEAKSYLPQNFVAISDDETGGLYGYVTVEGKCREGICYWDHDCGEIGGPVYEDVFEYVVAVGLSN